MFGHFRENKNNTTALCEFFAFFVLFDAAVSAMSVHGPLNMLLHIKAKSLCLFLHCCCSTFLFSWHAPASDTKGVNE